MSNNRPDKYGGALSPTKTSNMEVRVAKKAAGLAYNSEDFQVLGNAVPGSFNPQPTMNKTEARYGVTSVTHEQHMSERDAAFTVNMNEATARARQLAYASDLPVIFNEATTGFTGSTVSTNATTDLFFALDTTTGLTTDDLLLITHFAGNALKEFKEERYVERVDGAVVYLRYPVSKPLPSGTVVKRLLNFQVREGGTNYEELHFNLKTTAVDSSIHVLDYPNARIDAGVARQGSNSELMGTELTVKAMATPVVAGNSKEPVFSTETIIPRNVAKALT
jgi:hypothetical protein